MTQRDVVVLRHRCTLSLWVINVHDNGLDNLVKFRRFSYRHLQLDHKQLVIGGHNIQLGHTKTKEANSAGLACTALCAIANLTRPYGVLTIVSLNPVMVDGTGMCGGCRVKVGDTIKFACVDGPDFDGHQVDFDDLMARLGRYKPTEKAALEVFNESCRIRNDAPAAPTQAR